MELLNTEIAAVVDWIGFRLNDNAETCFLVLYFSACFLAVILDLFISCFMVYRQLEKGHAVTHTGKAVVELGSWIQIFESYPMQRALGMELFFFSFHMCCLVPFIIEPIWSVFLPMQLGKYFVRSKQGMDIVMAEKCLMFTSKVEFKRYADVLFNLMLAVCMFFFPGGYVLITFGALLGSHIYIYAHDQWKTLRGVSSFYFSSNNMDHSACAMLAIPTGILLVATIFKAHFIKGVPETGSYIVFLECMLAFAAHVVLYLLFVLFLAPRCGKRAHMRSQKKYASAATTIACSWFTSNPMHCLRSKHLYKHKPAATFFVKGKEHLIRPNPEIGIHFKYEDS
jgi:hypothetical protein